MSKTEVKKLEELLQDGATLPDAAWQLRMIRSEQCLSYVAWNTRTHEALLIDPKEEDHHAYVNLYGELPGYRWLGIIDTHTHADHVSIAAAMAAFCHAPLIMHALAPSQRVHLRVSQGTTLAAQAAPIQFALTPGHTPDGLTVFWGPFIFGGDTLLFNDTGRDDLPGGDAEHHYASVQLIKSLATPEMILLPGHDHKGGRAATWARQLETNPSLKQGHAEFVREARAFDAPAPALLKESLRENFK